VTGGALPAGLTLNAGTGVISGTPIAAGAFAFTITATNSSGAVSATYTGAVAAQLAATGTPIGPPIAVGVLLLLAGATLLALRRRGAIDAASRP
jgi:hypothetical protein